MVDWMQAKFATLPPKDIKHVNNLVRSKLLNEKITVSSTAKEIRGLQIKEASTRAERDKAMEMLDEISAKLEKASGSSPLEIRILKKKLGESKYTEEDVKALCEKLQKRQTALNETKKQFEAFKDLAEDTNKKSDENTKLLKEAHENNIKKLTEEIEKKAQKKLVEKYVELKLNQSGLKVHKNAQALLEKCTSTDDVDKIYVDIKEAMRVDALRPNKGQISEVKVEESVGNSVVSEIVNDVKNAMSGM